MEQEILNTLQEIRGILFVLSCVMSVAICVWVFNWIINIYYNFKKAYENYFIDIANEYYSKAQFSELEQHCVEKLKKEPNNTNAIWWLAKSKMSSGSLDEAKELFNKLLLLQPSWKDTHIDPYLNEIEKQQDENASQSYV